MAVISHPGTNEFEAVLATLRSMWECAVHCGGGTVPTILSRPLDEVVGKMYRNVNYLADVQAAVNALCEHATTKAVIQRTEGWCCSGYEPNSWPVYIRYQAFGTSMALPSRLVLTQSDWFDDISALVTWLSMNVYTGTGCPNVCFDQVSSVHPQCLSVTGWESLSFTAVIAETPDPEAAGYDDEYYTWDGALQWVGDDWWLESCFANTRIAYLATVVSIGPLTTNYWMQYNTSCEDKTPLIAGHKINVYLIVEGTNYKKYTLSFETACAGVVVWQGCKEGGGNVAGTYTRTLGRSSAPPTMTVASTDCVAPRECPERLAEQYVLKAGATNRGSLGTHTGATLEDIILTRDEYSQCGWSGQGRIVIDQSLNGPVEIVGFASVGLLPCHWDVNFGGGALDANGRKMTGQSPAGSYVAYDQGQGGDEAFSATVVEAT